MTNSDSNSKSSIALARPALHWRILRTVGMAAAVMLCVVGLAAAVTEAKNKKTRGT